MGTIYSIIPISKTDSETIDWIKDTSSFVLNIDKLRSGLLPNPKELLEMIKQIGNCKISTNENESHYEYFIEIKDNDSVWTQVIIRKGDNEFYFSKGDINLIKSISKIISDKHGSFALIDDAADIIDIFY